MNTITPGCPSVHCTILLAGLLYLITATASAGTDALISEILAEIESPAGVLFEVVQGDPAGLNWAIPKIRSYIEQLRERFVDIPVAVISHGQEQFSLLSKNAQTNEIAHSLARDFLATVNLPIEVCGNHAGMYGLKDGDYPDYVEVVDAAPRRVRHYREMGYRVIVVRKKM